LVLSVVFMQRYQILRQSSSLRRGVAAHQEASLLRRLMGALRRGRRNDIERNCRREIIARDRHLKVVVWNAMFQIRNESFVPVVGIADQEA
jgi:hypothetical protein